MRLFYIVNMYIYIYKTLYQIITIQYIHKKNTIYIYTYIYIYRYIDIYKSRRNGGQLTEHVFF